MNTHKERMLNGYKGIRSDFYPVAPEFWFYYPAKILGVSMIELQREIPHWKALQAAFRRFDCEGWGVVKAEMKTPYVEKNSLFYKLDERNYRLRETIQYRGNIFETSQLFNIEHPSWIEEYPVKNEKDLDIYLQYIFTDTAELDFKPALEGYMGVGDDYLLEYDLGLPFFDQIAFAMGFENALMYFLEEDEKVLNKYFEHFMHFQQKQLLQAIQNTTFESYFIGCGYSCISLIGPDLWRRWDKPYIKTMADILHKYGKLLHIHYHGKCMEVLDDFVDIGIDCVCPFERTPGDVNGLEGLKEVRRRLGEVVTFNGNIHTVEALAKGTPSIVRQQVREIKEAFIDSSRLIIGTGDQVPGETPEENIFAMIEEGRGG